MNSYLGPATITTRHRRRWVPIAAVVAVLAIGLAIGGALYERHKTTPAVNKAALVPWMNNHLAAFQHLRAAIDDYGRQTLAADVNGTTPATGLLGACNSMGYQATAMLAAATIPGAQIRQHLVAALRGYASVAATCRRAAEHGLAGHSADLQSANAQLRTAGSEMTTASNLISRALK